MKKDISERKLRRKAKIKAIVKLKLQKRLLPVSSFISRLEELKADLESFNPRMNQLQPHTKTRWIERCEELIKEAKEILEPKKKEPQKV